MVLSSFSPNQDHVCLFDFTKTKLSVLVFIVNVLFISFRWGLLGPSCNEMSCNCFCTACHHQYATMELNMIRFTPGFAFFLPLLIFFIQLHWETQVGVKP